jgi:hypothetical protein
VWCQHKKNSHEKRKKKRETKRLKEEKEFRLKGGEPNGNKLKIKRKRVEECEEDKKKKRRRELTREEVGSEAREIVILVVGGLRVGKNVVDSFVRQNIGQTLLGSGVS